MRHCPIFQKLQPHTAAALTGLIWRVLELPCLIILQWAIDTLQLIVAFSLTCSAVEGMC